MYKKYNFKPEILSTPRRSLGEDGSLSRLAERLLPFLLIATTFVWLWR